jgi:endonuclease YncB( thermonuclease family)
MIAAVVALIAAVWLLAPMVATRLQVGPMLPVAIGIAALLIAVGPTLFSRVIQPILSFAAALAGPLRGRFGWSRLSPPTRTALLGGTATVVVASVVYGVWTSGPTMPNVGLGGLSLFSGAPIEGRGVALSGDLLRIGDKTIRLSGIEAPERDQSCRRGATERQPGRSWRCGQAAIEALNQTVRGRPLTCTPGGTDSAGVTLARCIVGIEDVAAMLVRGGHVFSDGGLMARYGAYETEARAKKVGLWQGEAERPSEYRSKRWDEAKRKAPSGCPIKGQVSAQGREYFTPWTAGYERVRVKEARGKRWFCSETEAQAAGFKAAERS